MELTLESAFSPGGMVGNASYILLILSMAMRNMFWLRVLAIFSGIAGIAYDVIWLTDPVGAFWETLFTLVNLGQWLLLVSENHRLKLTPEERSYRDRFFAMLGEAEAKQLLRHSKSVSVDPGVVLTRQGEKVLELCMIVEGQVEIERNGTIISTCGQGDFIGEISYLTGAGATATSIAKSKVKILCFSKENLATILKTSELLGQKINATISQNLVKKLMVQAELTPQGGAGNG